MTLSADKALVIENFLDFLVDPKEKEMCIEGGPGMGKTFLIEHAIKAAESQASLLGLITGEDGTLNIHVTATTNKAVRVIGGESQTIYSFLNVVPKDNTFTGKRSLIRTKNFELVKNSLVIVDEAGMLCTKMVEFIRESTRNCKVVYILDAGQLLPIFEKSCVVSDMVNRKAFLTEPNRQAKNSPIWTLGNDYRRTVLEGAPFPKIQDVGNQIIQVDGPSFQAIVDHEFSDPNVDPEHVKVMAWTNNQVTEYNNYIRGLHIQDPLPIPDEVLIANEPVFNKEGKVVIPNDSYVTVGYIDPIPQILLGVKVYTIETTGGTKVNIVINQAEWKNALNSLVPEAKANRDWSYFYRCKEFVSDLRSTSASTVHKSQGSTYHTSLIDLTDIGRCYDADLVARLLTVATSRATDKVVLYGKLPKRYGG